jgi:hypothetical protein
LDKFNDEFRGIKILLLKGIGDDTQVQSAQSGIVDRERIGGGTQVA